MITNKQISQFEDLITSKEETRAGFISFALEKNKRSTPFIESAKAFKVFASKAKSPDDLLKIPEIRNPLLSAAGLSDKALQYFTENDKNIAIHELIERFLKPAGKGFVEEAVYRYLLIKGDSLGGSMRNLVGALAQQKLVRCLLANLSILNIDYIWLDGNDKKHWKVRPNDDYQIENLLKAICWKFNGKSKILSFNVTIPIVKNNVDICLFDSDIAEYDTILEHPDKSIMYGELKGGIDPAGADEHWKTGNSALNRIRSAFKNIHIDVKTSFIGAAIETKMAQEIFSQLNAGILTNAANLTKNNQLVEYCNWVIQL